MKVRRRNAGLVVGGIAAALSAAFASPAAALDFEFGDGWSGTWDNSFSLGTAWRARDADPMLYSRADGQLVGKTDGLAPNTIDEGNLNYNKGDRFTTQAKLFTEVHVKKGDAGALVRAKAWYDYTLNKEDVQYGNQNNGYNGYDPATNTLGAPRPLSDDGFERLNRYKGVYLLDAYVYDTFDVAGKPLQGRVGNQVVNWGESLFIQGLNQINPIDVPSFRKPGAQLKEVFLPVPIVYGNQSLGSAGSLEAFYQWKWKNTPIEASCGNYWSVAESNIGTSVGPCNNAISLGALNGLNQPSGTSAGVFIPAVDTDKPRDSGEFGVAYRFTADALDTEFGVYGMQLHSRTPVISITNINGFAPGKPFSVIWEYPEEIKVYGMSAATNLWGWSVAGEVSTRRDVPAQVDGNDLLLAGAGASGFLSAAAGDPGATPIPFGPYGNAAMAAKSTGYLPGYTRTNLTQLQLNTVKAGNRLLGGDQYIFVAEVGVQKNDLPDYKKDPNALRYGRNFIFGPGPHAQYGPTCLRNPATTQTATCENDGFVTPYAWGYRFKLDVTYNDAFAGVAVTPSVFFSHDVKGYSVDSQFIEDRRALSLGLKFSYAKKYTLDLGATTYNHNAKYDPLRDRDFYSATMSVGF